ncbi:serine hydrolase domain-containing protein [Taklimakanibacter lacteus]|uniref:serine hydrolase domain-containing protein n=1 Tax=Taklimakanibacter lacteus TaxID=2268456 RepID=UPI0013C53A2B
MRFPHLRWLARALLVTLALSAGALAYAPYLPHLLAEGFPTPEWPAHGAFADIAGAAQPQELGEPLQTTLAPGLAKLFQESGGKALLVYQGGQLQLEYYAPGFSRDTQFNSFSLAKSLVGLLALKAAERGEIPELDAPIPALGVTPRDLLDMKSGIIFETDEMKTASGQPRKNLEATISNPFGPMARLHASGLKGVVERLHSDPGRRGVFSYQNVNTALLGSLLPALDTRLSHDIWGPSGSRDARWRRYGAGLDISAYCCLYARARDWVLAARFIMHNGTPGHPLLSDESNRAFLGQDLSTDELRQGAYRLHAWHDILDRPGEKLQGRFTYFMGNGGQAVYLMPEKDLVVVRFGSRPQLLHSTLYEAWRQIAGP